LGRRRNGFGAGLGAAFAAAPAGDGRDCDQLKNRQQREAARMFFEFPAVQFRHNHSFDFCMRSFM
jgi:hypothetical protein